MWNESATRAREWTAYPAINSTKKKAVSMPRSIIIRVDLESPMMMEWGAPSALVQAVVEAYEPLGVVARLSG